MNPNTKDAVATLNALFNLISDVLSLRSLFTNEHTCHSCAFERVVNHLLDRGIPLLFCLFPEGTIAKSSNGRPLDYVTVANNVDAPNICIVKAEKNMSCHFCNLDCLNSCGTATTGCWLGRGTLVSRSRLNI